MESFCLTHSIPPCSYAIGIPFRRSPSTRFGAQPRPHRLLVSSKKSVIQDFQGYSKPLRLVPATQVNECTIVSPEETLQSIDEVESQSLYRILLRTSPFYGSELTDMSAGILVCIISETGDSILQRIPATTSFYKEHVQESEDVATQDAFRFKRSSTDEIIFQGPRLGNIEAVWISVESGRWRLGGANLTVINGSKPQSEDSTEYNSEYTSVRYDFEAEDILLGEGGEISMIELIPSKITEYSNTDMSQLLNKDITRSTFYGEELTKEESMQEYTDLKFSLLLYDAILVFSGTSIASFTAGENSALAFLTGGIGGFLYLLLLQRSVDGIQAPDTILQRKEEEDDISRGFVGLKVPLLIMAFSFCLAILVAKRGSMEADTVLLSPKEIVVGMMGFLACKVAVLLAAFKPLSIGLKDAE